MFAIVAYDDSAETDYVPLKWLSESECGIDVRSAVENKQNLTFYWPPYRNPTAITRAKSLLTDPETNWLLYSGRILSTAG